MLYFAITLFMIVCTFASKVVKPSIRIKLIHQYRSELSEEELKVPSMPE